MEDGKKKPSFGRESVVSVTPTPHATHATRASFTQGSVHSSSLVLFARLKARLWYVRLTLVVRLTDVVVYAVSSDFDVCRPWVG